MQDTAHDEPGSGLTRRQVLARGAVGGAVLWSVPTLQIIGATAADAASGPPTPPSSGEPVTPAPAPTEGLPGHGFAVVDGGSGPFVVKIDSGSPGALSGLGNQDEEFLRAQGTVEGAGYRQPTAADLAAFGAAGNGFGAAWWTPAGAAEPQAALFLVLPNGHEVRQAFTFDGSLKAKGKAAAAQDRSEAATEKDADEGKADEGKADEGKADEGKADKGKTGCGDGDKYTPAHVSGRLVYFVATCNDPVTGEG